LTTVFVIFFTTPYNHIHTLLGLTLALINQQCIFVLFSLIKN